MPRSGLVAKKVLVGRPRLKCADNLFNIGVVKRVGGANRGKADGRRVLYQTNQIRSNYEWVKHAVNNVDWDVKSRYVIDGGLIDNACPQGGCEHHHVVLS